MLHRKALTPLGTTGTRLTASGHYIGALVPHSSAFRTTQSEKLHPYSSKVKLNKLMEQGIINHMHFLDFEFTED